MSSSRCSQQNNPGLIALKSFIVLQMTSKTQTKEMEKGRIEIMEITEARMTKGGGTI